MPSDNGAVRVLRAVYMPQLASASASVSTSTCTSRLHLHLRLRLHLHLRMCLPRPLLQPPPRAPDPSSRDGPYFLLGRLFSLLRRQQPSPARERARAPGYPPRGTPRTLLLRAVVLPPAPHLVAGCAQAPGGMLASAASR